MFRVSRIFLFNLYRFLVLIFFSFYDYSVLERSYPGIPASYYAVIFSTMVVASTILVSFYPLQLPIAGLFLAIAMSVAFLIPVGIIAAITNTVLGLNVITELVAGFIYQGKPIANIVFKVS